MFEEYRERDKLLLQLGFSCYKEYLSSSLWELIRQVVFSRDDWKCLIPTCRSRKNHRDIQVHHLAYSRGVLLGINPGLLVTICSSCHEFCEFDKGVKVDCEEMRNRTLRLITQTFKRPGQSQRKIGLWFRNRYQTNQPVARKIFLLMKRKAPDYYGLICEDIERGRLPRAFASYLGIAKEQKAPPKRRRK